MRKVTAAVLAFLLWPMSALAANLSLTITASDDNTPVADAVVYLDRVDEVVPVTAEIYQKDREFHPKILILPVGSQVEFPNRDNTQHHVYSFSPAKTFNIELYAGKPQVPVLFDQPGIVELGCNIHDHMQAFIVISQTAAIGQTDVTGRVTLPVTAAEPVTLKIWHPRLPDNTQPITRTWDSGSEHSLSIHLVPEPEMDDSINLLQRRFQEL
ncbi:MULTISPECIES: methylamine utilization protein [Marinobacter]|jgi:plastocyanin|uniref:methylamine utilization protein n=1 Tax=Marinobacter TaxID=2742 RepID=UPI001FFFD1AD|nr:methylamine utilization protein [Marinobacter alexandrii]MCK2148479.1 methylamine utilization protein [Marinobacter alexandrii]